MFQHLMFATSELTKGFSNVIERKDNRDVLTKTKKCNSSREL